MRIAIARLTLLLIGTSFCQIALSWQATEVKDIESIEIGIKMPSPWGHSKLAFDRDSKSGKVIKFSINAENQSFSLNRKSFENFDYVDLSNIKILYSAPDFEEGHFTFSVCMPYGNTSFAHKFGKEERWLRPLMAIWVSEEGLKVWDLYANKEKYIFGDSNGCTQDLFYLKAPHIP